MFDAISQVPAPYNEPVHSFAPGSAERTVIEAWYPYFMRRLAERPANLRFFLRALAGH